LQVAKPHRSMVRGALILNGGIVMTVFTDTVEQAHLRFSLLKNLKSELAQKIDFWCNGIHVDGAGFMAVYYLLASDVLDVKIDDTMDHNLAVYSPLEKSFIFPNANFGDLDGRVGERALTIHESVHAMIHISAYAPMVIDDQPNITLTRYHMGLTTMEDEAVAYVAQALYLTYYWREARPGDNPIIDMALRIAGRIMNDDGATVSDLESSQLQTAIAADPHYAHKLYFSQDGL
jgi:hypothetical protein